MNNEPMPSGCLSIEAAAQLLCVTQHQLRKMLHERHWLEKKDGHNTPTKLGIEAGFLKTQARGYQAPFNKKMTLTYYSPVITQHGIDTLMQPQSNQQNQPQPTAQAVKSEPQKEPENFFNAANDARDEAMKLINEWLPPLEKVG